MGAIWHVVPLLQAHHGPAWIAWKGLETLAARVLIVWLYNNTGKSLFAAVLFHALSNVSVALFPNAGSHYDPAVTGALTAVVAGTVQLAPWKRRCRSWTASARSGTGPSTGKPGTTSWIGRVRTGGGGTPSSPSQPTSCSDELT